MDISSKNLEKWGPNETDMTTVDIIPENKSCYSGLLLCGTEDYHALSQLILQTFKIERLSF